MVRRARDSEYPGDNKRMKKDTTIYWIATGIIGAVMIFSIVNFNLEKPVGPPEGSFAHLGLPEYFRIELTVAKALGVLALLLPGAPRRAKEFAYAGFAITLASAAVAHFSLGDGIMFVIDPLLFLVVLMVSYRYFEKLQRGAHAHGGRLIGSG